MVTEKLISLLVEDYDKNPEELSADTKFEELAFDSLDIAELVMSLEDHFNIAVEMNSEIQTIGQLAAHIESKMS